MKFVSARERGQCGVCNVQIRPDRTSLHGNGWFVEVWFWFLRFGCFCLANPGPLDQRVVLPTQTRVIFVKHLGGGFQLGVVLSLHLLASC